MFNGGVEALTTLVGAGGAYIAGIWGGAGAVAGAAAVQALSVFVAVFPHNIIASYVGYTLAGVLYHYIITLAR